MGPVVVLAKKVARGGALGFANYVNQLSKKAHYSPGFISTSSYWKCWDFTSEFDNKIDTTFQDPPTLITLSHWISHDDWERWYHSEERESIKKIFRNDIDLEHFTVLRKQRKPNDIFLL